MIKKNFLSIISIIVMSLFVVLVSTTYIFAYIPTLKFSSTITQSFSCKCFLQHNNVTLFSTDYSQNVTDESVGDNLSYQVQPVGKDLIKIKSTYGILKNSEDEIVFTITNVNITKNCKLTLHNVNVYGVDLDLASDFVTAVSSYSKLTISFNATLILEDDDEVTLIVKFENAIPSIYTQQNYLQSNGTQYIDTGILSHSSLRTDIKFEYTALNNGYNRVFGTAGINGSQYGVRGSTNTGGTLHCEIPTCNNVTSIPIGLNYVYEIIFNDESHNILLNGDKIGFLSNYTEEGTQNVYIFTHNAPSFVCSSLKIYYAKMILNNEVVRHFIPVVRNSDGVAGFYDLVNNVFYTSANNKFFAAN